jgi:hypothetical protein
MEALLILVVLPVLLGVAAERLFADTSHAALAAALATGGFVYASLRWLAPDEAWNGLAALLVSPLTIAL